MRFVFETGLKLLFSTFSQLIFVVLAYEYYVVYKLKLLGQANLEPLRNVNPLICYIIIAELLISLTLLGYGWSRRKNI